MNWDLQRLEQQGENNWNNHSNKPFETSLQSHALVYPQEDYQHIECSLRVCSCFLQDSIAEPCKIK